MNEGDSADDKIGFPPPLLGEQGVRLDVLYNDASCFALARPAGVVEAKHDFYPRMPRLSAAISWQAEGGKPELERLGITDAFPVLKLDGDTSGVSLFGKNEGADVFLREQYGSREMELRFVLLVRSGSPTEEEITCDLPIARHFSEERMVVSHSSGKKATTLFRKLEDVGTEYALWEAVTDFCRPHQVRLHAVESGLRVVGDRLYANQRPLLLSQLKRKYRGKRRDDHERPLYPHVCVHLKSLRFTPPEDEPTAVEAELPQKFEVLLKKIRQFRHEITFR